MRISDWSSDVCSSDLFRQLSGTDLPANGDARGYPVGHDNPPWQRERPDGNAVRPLRGYAASRSSSATGTCATTACPSSASAGSTAALAGASGSGRSEKPKSEPQSLMRTSFAVFGLKQKNITQTNT